MVIAVTESSVYQNCEIWISFAHGNELRYIPCHLTASALGEDASCGLLFFHAEPAVIVFQNFVELERKRLGVFGTVCLT